MTTIQLMTVTMHVGRCAVDKCVIQRCKLIFRYFFWTGGIRRHIKFLTLRQHEFSGKCSNSNSSNSSQMQILLNNAMLEMYYVFAVSCVTPQTPPSDPNFECRDERYTEYNVFIQVTTRLNQTKPQK